MTSLKTLTLEGRGLKLDSATDVETHIVPLLSHSASITSLDLSGNTIGVQAAEALAPYLSKLTSLNSANLADIFTSRLLSEIPPALDALLSALLPLDKLHTINLSDNAFGLNTQAPLVKFLERHTPLRHLILNNNGLGPEAGALVADALTRLAEGKKKISPDCTPLETIVCGRNRLENGSSSAWARALAIHASGLKEVRLAQNGIRVEGVSLIIREGLRLAKGLRFLELQDNLFTVPGAQALAESLEGWTNLEELAIQDTLLRPQGGLLISKALTKGKNKELRVLRLQYNEVNSRGIKVLLQALDSGALPNLRRIELNGNKFTEEDPSIEKMNDILHSRKGMAEVKDQNSDWGLDELDELDDESEEEDGSDEEDAADYDVHQESQEIDTTKIEAASRLADEAEQRNDTKEKDADVEKLTERLDKTAI